MHKLPQVIARELLDGADEAAQLIARAETAAQGLREAAHAEGYHRGLAQGHADGIARVLAQLDPQSSERCFSAAQVKQLAFAIAERVLRRELACDPSYLTQLLSDQLAQLDDLGPLAITIHPSQRDVAEALLASRPGVTATITEEATLAPGDCVVSVPGASVDGRLQTQLAQLRRAIGSGEAE